MAIIKKKQFNSSNKRGHSSVLTSTQPRNKQLKENNNQSKKTMDAYHPHGLHNPRSFKDYILEFIMIFVAITGGFFMENIREHVVDRNKEKEFILRLVRDIKQDTTNLKNIIYWNNVQMKNLDSLANLVEKPIPAINLNKFLSLLTNELNNTHSFISRDITMSQLKNTGGLRLIENANVLDSIVIYYNYIMDSEVLKKWNTNYSEESFREEVKFINFSQIIKTGKLNITDKSKMKELGDRCFIFKIQVGVYNRLLKNVYDEGTSLLKCLKREYKLKD